MMESAVTRASFQWCYLYTVLAEQEYSLNKCVVLAFASWRQAIYKCHVNSYASWFSLQQKRSLKGTNSGRPHVGLKSMLSKSPGHGTKWNIRQVESLSLWNYRTQRKHEIFLNMVFGLLVVTLMNCTLKKQGIGEWVLPLWEGHEDEYFPCIQWQMFYINRKWGCLVFLITENVDLIEERCSMIIFLLASEKKIF